MPQTTDELFERAVSTHTRRLLAIARGIVGNRASPEDVVQQAIMNLYQHRDRYDWREPGGLMRRSVVNEALRILRQPRMSVVADDHPASAGAASQSPVGGMIDQETVAQVRKAIDQLPEHFRAALEISHVLDVTVAQVKTWLHRGRRQLAERLKEYMDTRK